MMSSREMRFTTHSGALFAVTVRMEDLRRGGESSSISTEAMKLRIVFWQNYYEETIHEAPVSPQSDLYRWIS